MLDGSIYTNRNEEWYRKKSKAKEGFRLRQMLKFHESQTMKNLSENDFALIMKERTENVHEICQFEKTNIFNMATRENKY